MNIASKQTHLVSDFLYDLSSSSTTRHSDILDFLLGKNSSEEAEGDYEEAEGDYEAVFLEKLSEEDGSLPPEVAREARKVREESMRRYYQNLTHPAPHNIFEAASSPLSDASIAHMQQEESRRIERPNLSIPVRAQNGAMEYVTLAQ